MAGVEVVDSMGVIRILTAKEMELPAAVGLYHYLGGPTRHGYFINSADKAQTDLGGNNKSEFLNVCISDKFSL